MEARHLHAAEREKAAAGVLESEGKHREGSTAGAANMKERTFADCRKIIERRGGSIRASSKPGKDSTYTINPPPRRLNLTS